MSFCVAEVHFDLERRITEEAEKLQLCRFLQRHQVEDKDTQRPYILMEGHSLIDGEDTFFVKFFLGGKTVSNFNRHSAFLLKS